MALIAEEAPADYDAWAVRWLRRWLADTGAATIEQAGELVGILANLPVDPRAGEANQALLGGDAAAGAARGQPSGKE